jgi:hypothetical protein
LIAIVRRDSVDEWATGGVPLGGEVSSEILEAIFRKVSPVHDGAAIVEGGRISRVAAVLPLSETQGLPGAFGTRHRAAMGLAECCDALVIAVSEERGTVTLFERGTARAFSRPEELLKELEQLLKDSARERSTPSGVVTSNLGLKAAAVGLAALISGALSLSSGTAVRTLVASVELTNVPPGFRVTGESVSALQVRVRGRSWLLDSVGRDRLVARFDLRASHEGVNVIPTSGAALGLPPGVTWESTVPENLTVRLSRPDVPRGDQPRR